MTYEEVLKHLRADSNDYDWTMLIDLNEATNEAAKIIEEQHDYIENLLRIKEAGEKKDQEVRMKQDDWSNYGSTKD
jgi:hypothetical protein